MGLFKHLRSKSRLKSEEHVSLMTGAPTSRTSRDLTARLPDHLLRRILIQVCPHSQDESYLPSESSAFGEGCMLCDLRDLAQCTQVCRRWYGLAQNLLYKSVRIDAVHFCELEEALGKKRQRKSFLKSAVEVGDVPGVRLSLFCQTVRDSQELASRVEFLKLPQMTRETSKAELARTVSVLPNLKYVDLPDGVTTGNPSCLTLVTELQARCPNIRKMVYAAGAELSFSSLADGHWRRLESLSLSGMAIEVAPLRNVLSALPSLSDLTIADDPRIDDSLFSPFRPSIADFPALKSLTLTNTPYVTAAGLQHYASDQQTCSCLTDLALNHTGVAVQDLHTFLSDLSALQSLVVTQSVSRSIAIQEQDRPSLHSTSLNVVHFEITDSEDAHGLTLPSDSYYTYLAQSLLAYALPSVKQVYVCDPVFADRLLFTANNLLMSAMEKMNVQDERPGRCRPQSYTAKPSIGLRLPLQVFSKASDESEYTFTEVAPSSQKAAGLVVSGGRPLSAYSASQGLGPQWASPALSGVEIVGNGFGGFLAVPAKEAVSRPGSRLGSSHGNANAINAMGASPFMAAALRARGRSASPGPDRFPGNSSRHASPLIGARSPSPGPGSFPFARPELTDRPNVAAYLGVPGMVMAATMTDFVGRSRSESGPISPYLNPALAAGGNHGPAPTRPNFLRSRSHHSDDPNEKGSRKTRQDLWR